MPEGDTVFRAARRLDQALRGGVVARFDLRVPALATADLRGEPVHDVVPRGKHLLMRIGEHTLHSHLKMEGEWRVFAPGARWTKPAYAARAIVGVMHRGAVPDAEAVGFEIAMLDLVRTRDENELVGYLGPDPLSAQWDPAEAGRRLSADARPIHVALLDQRNVAGFGNEYVNELLFVRGIHPTTPAPEVEVAGLLETGVRMMRQNVTRADRTFTGQPGAGRSTWVYRRERRACRRCGSLIQGGSLGADPTRERIVFWCPSCQRPATERGGSPGRRGG